MLSSFEWQSCQCSELKSLEQWEFQAILAFFETYQLYRSYIFKEWNALSTTANRKGKVGQPLENILVYLICLMIHVCIFTCNQSTALGKLTFWCIHVICDLQAFVGCIDRGFDMYHVVAIILLTVCIPVRAFNLCEHVLCSW